jgi:tRNA (guanine-N7-)-methyltransferase
LVSDVAEYFEVIRTLLDAQAGLRLLELPLPTEPAHDLDYLTNFERKYRKEARPIYRAIYQRL